MPPVLLYWIDHFVFSPASVDMGPCLVELFAAYPAQIILCLNHKYPIAGYDHMIDLRSPILNFKKQIVQHGIIRRVEPLQHIPHPIFTYQATNLRHKTSQEGKYGTQKKQYTAHYPYGLLHKYNPDYRSHIVIPLE
jgi:hypothetical protein